MAVVVGWTDLIEKKRTRERRHPEVVGTKRGPGMCGESCRWDSVKDFSHHTGPGNSRIGQRLVTSVMGVGQPVMIEP